MQQKNNNNGTLENSESESKCGEQNDCGSEEYVSSTDNAESKSECNEQTHSGNNTNFCTTLMRVNPPMGRCHCTATDMCGPAGVPCIFCGKPLKNTLLK